MTEKAVADNLENLIRLYLRRHTLVTYPFKKIKVSRAEKTKGERISSLNENRIHQYMENEDVNSHGQRGISIKKEEEGESPKRRGNE